MSVSMEQLMVLLEAQQKRADAQLAAVLDRVGLTGSSRLPTVLESLGNSMTDFIYDPEEDLTFDVWFSRYEDLFKEDAATLDDSTKVRLLLRKLHTSVHDKFVNYILPRTPHELSFPETVKTLRSMFGPQSSLFSIRYKCLKLTKKPDDDYVAYSARVNKSCERFKLASLNADQFKCLVFVCGLQAPEYSLVRTRLLDKIETDPSVTLQLLTDECNRVVNLRKDAHMIEAQNDSPTTVIAKTDYRRMPQAAEPSRDYRPRPTNNARPPRPCWLCGEMHFVRNCTFQSHKCSVCHSVGHKEGYCPPRKNGRKFQMSNQQFGSNNVYTIASVRYSGHNRYVTISINGHDVRFQVDTGSEVTILTKDTWNDVLHSPALDGTDLTAVGVSGEPIKFLGKLNCKAQYGNQCAELHCFVYTKNKVNLLGAGWLTELDVYPVIDSLSREFNCGHTSTSPSAGMPSKQPAASSSNGFVAELRRKFPRVFEPGLGLCKKTQASLQLCPDAKPTFRPKRPISLAAQATVDTELNRLEQNGIISRTNYSKWAAPIVVVKKANGSIRICADFSTGLNDALELHRYPLPIPEDIFATLNGGCVFSQIDLADAYLQVEVDDPSKELLTINTHRGLYQYNRLPFGVKSAPGIFQEIMDVMLNGLTGTAAYLDDVIVVGRNESEHRRNLEAVFKRIEEFGFHVRLEKCHFLMPSVKYLGCIIDKNGRRPDPDKIEAISCMPPPTNVTELRSFLGLLNYYGSFVKEMQDLRSPLDAMLKKNARFEWTERCQNVFNRAKTILSSDLLLTHYNPQREILVAADASDHGIGAVIMHRFEDETTKAIAHASRSLNSAEKNYSQIEKEALALVFAVKKFHRMIHGRRFTLFTDHKPLLAIFGSKKGIPGHTASRLVRWATNLLAYNFDIQYTSTTSFGQADCLSRLISRQTAPDEDTVIASVTLEAEVRGAFTDALRVLPITAADVQTAMENDPTMQSAISYTLSTWPNHMDDWELKQLYNRREALSVSDGVLMFAERVVIPRSLRRAVLQQLHISHPGIVRMKSLARCHVYWPGMDQDVQNVVNSCEKCAEQAKMPVKVPLSPWPHPSKQWSRVHVDYAGPFEGHYFLILVDAFSKWPEVMKTDRITSTTTIRLLREVFSRFGMPETLVSDNGSQFVSTEFEDFCKSNGIKHIRTPPYHPQSNGQAERFVDTFKRSLLKLKGEGSLVDNLQKFLMAYRTTPNAALHGNQSPAEALMKFQPRTTMNLLSPRTCYIGRHSKMEEQFNRHHGTRPRSYKRGDLVYIRMFSEHGPRWTHGEIRRRRGRVLYDVVADGKLHKRHANQLRQRHPDNEELRTLMEGFGLAKPQSVDVPHGVNDAPVLRRGNRRRNPVRRYSPDPCHYVYDPS